MAYYHSKISERSSSSIFSVCKVVVVLTIVFLNCILTSLQAQVLIAVKNQDKTIKSLRPGDMQLEKYLPLLKGKKIALVANQTSVIGNTHLVDTLRGLQMDIKVIFAPEHGFRGNADAGEHVENMMDAKTGIPVVSLYGSHYMPTSDELKGIDVVVFDIQDVGVRFYTYISTLHYLMEACAANKVKLLILDRPNPNGFYVDGPMLDPQFKSFVGLDLVPLVYGMTMAEYALMLNGEHYLRDSLFCQLEFVKVENYVHSDFFELPVKPSPNLPNMASINLYPSLGLFEGTVVSVGRGTDKPFQVIGNPKYTKGSYSFTPRSIPGASKNPPFKGVECKGYDLSLFGDVYIRNSKKLYLFWLKDFYDQYPVKKKFFNDFFDKLAGTDLLRKQIINGDSEEKIRASWQADIKKFKAIRKKYLLYDDFE